MQRYQMAKKEKFIPKASIGQSSSSNATQIDRKNFIITSNQFVGTQNIKYLKRFSSELLIYSF